MANELSMSAFERCPFGESTIPPWSDTTFRARCWIASGLYPIFLIPIWMRISVGSGWSAPKIGLLVSTLAIVTITDWRWRKIPNWATYSTFLWLMLLAVCQGVLDGIGRFASGIDAEHPVSDFSTWLQPLGMTLIGGLGCFCVMFFVFQMAGGGAGDVKLATVIGAALGIELGFESLVASYILAAIAILVWLTWAVGPRVVITTFARKLGQMFGLVAKTAPGESETRILQQRIALGPFFAAGTLLTLLRATEAWQ